MTSTVLLSHPCASHRVEISPNMVLQLAAMALLVLKINVFNMTNCLMTCIFAMLEQWHVLCAAVWLFVSDPP